MKPHKKIAMIVLALALIAGPADTAARPIAEQPGVDAVQVVSEAAPSLLVSPLCWHVD